MPIIPEIAVSADDYAWFCALWKSISNFTEEDLKAYKHFLSLGAYRTLFDLYFEF